MRERLSQWAPYSHMLQQFAASAVAMLVLSCARVPSHFLLPVCWSLQKSAPAPASKRFGMSHIIHNVHVDSVSARASLQICNVRKNQQQCCPDLPRPARSGDWPITQNSEKPTMQNSTVRLCTVSLIESKPRRLEYGWMTSTCHAPQVRSDCGRYSRRRCPRGLGIHWVPFNPKPSMPLVRAPRRGQPRPETVKTLRTGGILPPPWPSCRHASKGAHQRLRYRAGASHDNCQCSTISWGSRVLTRCWAPVGSRAEEQGKVITSGSGEHCPVDVCAYEE